MATIDFGAEAAKHKELADALIAQLADLGSQAFAKDRQAQDLRRIAADNPDPAFDDNTAIASAQALELAAKTIRGQQDAIRENLNKEVTLRFLFERLAKNPPPLVEPGGPPASPTPPIPPGPPPPTPPSAPTAVTATPGVQSASVTWQPPGSDGGAVVIDYTVTASPGGASQTATSLSANFAGLTVGTAYTFSATARNSAGSGSGATSNPVTPTSPPPAVTHYPAESWTLAGTGLAVATGPETGWHDTGYINGFKGNDASYTATVTVTASVAGKVGLQFRYAAGQGPGARRLLVNGTQVDPATGNTSSTAVASFPATAGWNAWTLVTFVADLNAGSNTIRLDSGAGTFEYVNFDELDIVSPPAPDPTPEVKGIIGLHGSGGGPNASVGFGSGGGYDAAGSDWVSRTTQGNVSQGGGAYTWAYDTETDYQAALAVVIAKADEAPALTSIIIHGFSAGAAMAAAMYAHGETLGGRIIGYVFDDPAFYSGPITNPPPASVNKVLYGTRNATNTAWNVDVILGFNAMSQTETKLGLTAKVTPGYTTHYPYTDPSPPEIAAWFAGTQPPPQGSTTIVVGATNTAQRLAAPPTTPSGSGTTVTVAATAAAINSAIAAAVPGTVIKVNDGTVTGDITWGVAGTAANPIVLMPTNTGGVTLTGRVNYGTGARYGIIAGLIFTGTVSKIINVTNDGRDLRVHNCTFNQVGDGASDDSVGVIWVDGPPGWAGDDGIWAVSPPPTPYARNVTVNQCTFNQPKNAVMWVKHGAMGVWLRHSTVQGPHGIVSGNSTMCKWGYGFAKDQSPGGVAYCTLNNWQGGPNMVDAKISGFRFIGNLWNTGRVQMRYTDDWVIAGNVGSGSAGPCSVWLSGARGYQGYNYWRYDTSTSHAAWIWDEEQLVGYAPNGAPEAQRLSDAIIEYNTVANDGTNFSAGLAVAVAVEPKGALISGGRVTGNVMARRNFRANTVAAFGTATQSDRDNLYSAMAWSANAFYSVDGATTTAEVGVVGTNSNIGQLPSSSQAPSGLTPFTVPSQVALPTALLV